MSFDDYDDDDDLEQPEVPKGLSPAEIRILKKKAKQWDENETTLTKLQRENVLLRDDDLRKLDPIKAEALFSVHRGESTPEALRTTATALGWVAPPEPEVPDAEREAHARMEGVATGASSATAHDPVADALSAGSEEEFWAKAQAAGMVAE